MAGIPRVCQSSIAFFVFKVTLRSVDVTAVSVLSSYLSFRIFDLQYLFFNGQIWRNVTCLLYEEQMQIKQPSLFYFSHYFVYIIFRERVKKI